MHRLKCFLFEMASTETCLFQMGGGWWWQIITLPEVFQYIVVVNMKNQNIATLLLRSNRRN